MAVYRKKLVDKDGNTIIPAVGDIYGTVYEATLSSATAGGRADYEFTPDTPLENNKVYAVKFPAPTVNNATIILGDGVSSGSILVPPVAATDAPNYELLNTDMINDTEPLLLMYNGVQWVCLNQKKKVATADLENGAVTTNKIDWTTIGYKTGTANTASSSIVDKIVLSGLDISATYLAIGEIWINNTSGSIKDLDAYINGAITEEHLHTMQSWWNVVSFHSVLKPDNNAKIKLMYNSNGVVPNRARLTVIRIG